MGISGLLPALKSITETKALEEYRGQTLAIDGYCWLHRAIYSCSQEVCLGQETDKYVNYFIERVDILLRNGITPYVVFDGGPLPMKKGTEVERRAARQKNRELGIQYYKQRNYIEARKYFSRAADVSPFMAHRVIQRLKAKNVRYVVAPYEADAQLAYLTKNGLADGVITEDSDCLPFGCGTVLFKLDKDGVGLVQEIKENNLKKNKGLLFHMFTHEMVPHLTIFDSSAAIGDVMLTSGGLCICSVQFLEMCIFSGCDYLPSLPGFGLKKAYTALKQHGSFIKVVRALRLEGKVSIPLTYEAEFEKAVLTFCHQRVFDPRTKQLVPLTPIRDSDKANDDSMDFLGPMLANDVATAIAEGDMDPITMERFPVTAASTCSNNISNSCGGGQPIGARGNTLNTGAPSFSFKPSSFQGVRQAAPAAFQQPVTKMPSHSIAVAPSGSRRFPSSFGQRVELSTSLFGTMNTKASSTVALSSSSSSSTTLRSSESSPPVISRFFAAQPKRTSPLDEIEKSLDAMPASSSSFESQDPLEVNVARSISFSPVEEKKHAHATASANKENHTPIFSASREPVPPSAKENAFSRMMRAGSLLQRQSLKRKAAASSSTSSRHGKQKPGGMFAHQQYQQQQQRSAEQRLQQYARGAASNNTNQEKSDVMKDHVVKSVADTTLSSPYAAAEPEVEQDATEDVESQSNSSISVVVARGSCLSGAHQSSYAIKVACADEDYQQSHFEGKVASDSKPPTSSSVLTSLDRFRFKK